MAYQEAGNSPLGIVTNERWGNIANTKDIIDTLPAALQHSFVSLRRQYTSLIEPLMVTDWASPAMHLSSRLIELKLPPAFGKVLDQTVSGWGKWDKGFTRLPSGEKALALYSADSHGFPPAGELVIAYRPLESERDRLLVPYADKRLTTIGRAIIALGAIDHAAFQAFCKNPEEAFERFGENAYAHYLKRRDARDVLLEQGLTSAAVSSRGGRVY